MANHQEFNKAAAAKKMYAKPRPSKDIEQEYANAASALGDAYFASEIQRAKVQQLTVKLSELKDEHVAAKDYETEQAKKDKADGILRIPEIVEAPAQETKAAT